MSRWKLELEAMSNPWRETLRFAGILKRFGPLLRPQTWPIIQASLASLGFTAMTLLEPWPLQVVFDGVLLGRPVVFWGVDIMALAGGRPMMILFGAAASVMILALFRGQFYYIQNVKAATAGQDVVMGIRRMLYEHLQNLSLSFHHKAQSGDLLMRMTGDILMLREMVVAAMITLLTQSLVLIGIVAIMIPLNLKLTLVTLGVIPLLFVVISIFRLRLVAAAHKQRRREGRLASTIHETLSSVQLVQAYTAEKYETERFKEMNKRSLRAGVRLTRIEAQMNRSVQITLALGVCATLWLGSQDVLAERLSPGQLLVFLAYLRGLYKPLRQVSKLNQRLAKASACGDRVLEILDEKPEIRDPLQPRILRRVRGVIEFDGVDFSYTKHTAILHGIDLRLEAGEKVAIVGPTGAGKSTLISLLPRFYEPRQGEIRIDGIPIHELRIKSLRRQISFLTQETIVMGTSVMENIAYGAIGRKGSAATLAEVERAAKATLAHDFIMQLPRGYETVLGERGSTLSGGQRQRIAFARAMLRNAPIILLDEPTTGLDPVSSRIVLDAWEALSRNRTALIVAHNLSTILRADRIVFLENGRIVEQGTHGQLLDDGGQYAQFFRSEWGSISSVIDVRMSGKTREGA